MKKTLLILLISMSFSSLEAQVVVKMQMPPQDYEKLSSEVLFDELLPLDIPVVLSPVGYDINGGSPPYNYRWLENEEIISQDSTVIITAGAGNDYTLVVIDDNNCSVMIPVLTETSSRIETPGKEDKILNAYYSPAARAIIIKFNEEVNSDVSLRLIDFSGMVRYHKIIRNDHIIPLNSMSGFYIVDIAGEGFHYAKKIVIQ